MPEIKKDALFIIDGSYLLYRSYYAIKQLKTSSGIPTQAVYGFCRAIKKIIDDFNPTYLVISWDPKGKTFRHEDYPAYKATRQKPPSDLFEQKEHIIKFLEAVKIAQITVDGYEGDDVIAGIAKQFSQNQIILVCPDKDMYQLLSDQVLIFDPFKERLVDQEAFAKEQGFTADKVPFYYAILGDSSDNIPGVAGIGKKGAADLVAQFTSLDDLYANIDLVPKERTKKLLLEQKDLAFLSYQLFCLKPPAISKQLADLAFDQKNWAGAAELFATLEFSSLLKDLQKRFPTAVTTKQASNQPFNRSLFDQDAPAGAPAPLPWQLTVVQDEASLTNMIAKLSKADWIALDTETSGSLPMQDKLVGISFAIDTKQAFYVPVGHQEGVQLDQAIVIAALKPLLEKPTTKLVMHNAKFDQIVLDQAGIATKNIAFDTIIAASLLRKGDNDRINLKALSQNLLNEPMIKFKELLGKHRSSFDQVPVAEGAAYAAHDALQTYKIKPILEQELGKAPTLLQVFNTIEMPFYSVLRRMEEFGVMLNIDKILGTTAAVSKAIQATEETIFANLPSIGGSSKINLNSPKQIETLLFDQLGLATVKKSAKGSRSTDQEVLQALSNQHPVPALILKYRELTKLKTTYLEPLPSYVNPKTNRIHTSYSQTQVATGRLSSADPNLQNIPASEGFGMQIRDAFYAPSGSLLLSADYSQIELRILAHLSQDKALTAIFLNNQDIHTETSAQLFDVPVSAVTHEQRQLGKRINFSIMYGITPFGLAKDLGIKPNEAKSYIEKYFERFPGVAAWIEETTAKATERGYVETWYGRRRYIPELAERNKTLFEAGKRMAINTPVQGTQAEIMKLAMINIDQQLSSKNLAARIILQIHDELIIELPKNELEEVTPLVERLMMGVVNWQIPLKVTIRAGETWAKITK